jgi:hypothetical protein
MVDALDLKIIEKLKLIQGFLMLTSENKLDSPSVREHSKKLEDKVKSL